jgi:hypothetical protein
MSATLEAVTAGVEPIAALVRQVAELRRRRDQLNAKLAERRAAFFESIKPLTDEAGQLGSECASAEAMLRASALAHYEQTEETRPTAGVQVKLYTHLDYDREEADKWTRERGLARIPEQMNRVAFERIAKATPIPFVVKKQVPRVTIATDLEKALGVSAQ